MEWLEPWAWLYKLGRLVLLGSVLVGIALWLYRGSAREDLEAPARRMLEEEDA